MFNKAKESCSGTDTGTSPAMPPSEMLPEIPADSTWEFRTHRGHIHTFTGTRLDGDHSQYMIVKVNFNYWSKGYPGGDWCVKENLEIIGAVSKGSVEMWRKVDAVESTPQAV